MGRSDPTPAEPQAHEGERFMSYLIVRCVDEHRDEALNVAVLVLDPQNQRVVARVAESFDRVRRALPRVPVAHLRELIRNLGALTADDFLRVARGRRHMHGLIVVSDVRSRLGADLDLVADQLFTRYVADPEPIDAHD